MKMLTFEEYEYKRPDMDNIKQRIQYVCWNSSVLQNPLKNKTASLKS